MAKIKVRDTTKIHEAELNNLINIHDIRRGLISDKFKKLIGKSRHMTIISVGTDGDRHLYTTISSNEELLYQLEHAKSNII